MNTNFNDFMSELGGGAFLQKIENALSKAALAQMKDSHRKIVSKVDISFSMKQVYCN